MQTEWADSELSRQLFENAITATAAIFIAFAALMSLLSWAFWRRRMCFHLTAAAYSGAAATE